MIRNYPPLLGRCGSLFLCVSKLSHLFGVRGYRKVAWFSVGVLLQRGVIPSLLLFLLMFYLSFSACCLGGGGGGGVGCFLGCNVYVWPDLGISGPGGVISARLEIWIRSCLGMVKNFIPCLFLLWDSVPVFCVVEALVFREVQKQTPGRLATFPILF